MPEETTIAKFKGCEFLDFSPNYAAKRQQTSMGLFWMRDASPSMVQFCKKKGRLYGCDACLSEANKQCNSYAEVTHEIELPIAELEG